MEYRVFDFTASLDIKVQPYDIAIFVGQNGPILAIVHGLVESLGSWM